MVGWLDSLSHPQCRHHYCNQYRNIRLLFPWVFHFRIQKPYSQ